MRGLSRIAMLGLALTGLGQATVIISNPTVDGSFPTFFGGTDERSKAMGFTLGLTSFTVD